jgi:hypothetical protein
MSAIFDEFSVNGRRVKQVDNSITIFAEEPNSNVVCLPCGTYVKGTDGVFRHVRSPEEILKFCP